MSEKIISDLNDELFKQNKNVTELVSQVTKLKEYNDKLKKELSDYEEEYKKLQMEKGSNVTYIQKQYVYN